MVNRVMAMLIALLEDARKKEIIEDQTTRVEIDFEIALGKPEFNQVVRDIQTLMLNAMERDNCFPASKSIEYIELGAGVIPMSNLDSRIRSTDIVPTEHLNGVLDATNLDIENALSKTI
jgi:hypothetical protein